MQWGQMRRALPNLAARWRREADEPASPRPGREQAEGQRPVASSDWRRVPPIGVAIRSQPVLVGGPLLALPKVSGTRSLLNRESGEIEAGPDRLDLAVSPLPGRITGIVVPQPVTVSAGAKPVAPGAITGAAGRNDRPEPPSPARLHPAVRPAVGPAAARRQNLIEATGEFVGAPQPEENPYSSSAWLRMLQAYRLPAGNADPDPADAQLPWLTQAAKPDGGTVLGWSSEAAEPPRPQVPPSAGRPEAPARPADRPRRANLAESRRLGLGSPLSARPRPSPPEPGKPASRSGPTESERDEAEVRPEATVNAAASADPSAAASPAASADPSTSANLSASVRPLRAGLGAPITRGTIGPGSPDVGPAPLATVRPDTAVPRAGRPGPPRPSVPPGPTAPSDPEPPAPSPQRPVAPPLAASDLTRSASSARPATADGPAEPSPPVPQPMLVAPVYRAAPSARPVPPDQPAGASARPSGRPSGRPRESTVPAPLDRQTQNRPAASPAGPAGPAQYEQPPSPGEAEPARTEAARPEAARPAATRPEASEHQAGQPASAEPATSISTRSAQPLDSPAYRSPVPPDLADTVRRAHGIDVSDILVSRGPLASKRARDLGARAFASDGEVVLPIEAGPIERPQTRALLGHELTHIAQQRAHGPALPPEDSAAGAVLEQQARDTERRLLGSQPPAAMPEDFSPPWTSPFTPPALAPPRALPSDPALAPPQAQAPDPAPASAPAWAPAPASASAPAPTPSSSAPFQRQTEELATTGLATGSAFDPFALLPHQPVTEPPTTEPPAWPTDPDHSQSPPTPIEARRDDGFEHARARLLAIAGLRLLDLDDSVAIGNLADGIYRRVRARLRHELLVDRERSGLLSDFR
jgi:Domain of unknown function (DUF4157)